ncbi:MAG: glycosyltransferase family 61 protein [Pontiella sp.]
MGRLKKKITQPKYRKLHDTWALISSSLGNKALQTTQHEKIIHQSNVIAASKTKNKNLIETDFYLSSPDGFYTQSPVDLYELKNIWMTGAQGHLFFDQKNYLHICPSFDGISDKKIRRPIPALAQRIKNPVFILTGRGLGNRGHFLVEHLPRFLACRNFIPSDTKIMVPPKQKRWAKEYLAKLGISEDMIIEGSEGTILLEQAFYMPLFSNDEKARLAPKEFYQQLRDAFIQPSSRPRESIFISRKDADLRLMLNEDEIFDMAKSRFPDLRKVSMSALSLDEQIALFANAELVIGAHNQAFRNLMFCSGALCIQLVNGERCEQNEYYFWANNYSQLGTLFDNGCISLYSETPLDSDWNWTYPSDKFSKDLDRVINCWEK